MWVLFRYHEASTYETLHIQSSVARQFLWKENTTNGVSRLSNRGNVMIPLMKMESRLPSLMALLLISVCISALPVLLVMNEPNGLKKLFLCSPRRTLRPAFITSPCTITPNDGSKETTLSLAGPLHWGVECLVGIQQQWQRKPAFMQLLLSSTSSLSVMGKAELALQKTRGTTQE